MEFVGSLFSVLGAIGKYGALAGQAAAEAEARVGRGHGSTKLQIAVALILAAAHAGELVTQQQVLEIATAVDFAVNVANALGAFGPAKPLTLAVPPAVAPVATTTPQPPQGGSGTPPLLGGWVTAKA